MSRKCMKKLKELVKNVVLPDIEDHIDDMFEVIANNKNASQDDDVELKEMHEMRAEFQELLTDLDNDNIDQDECEELLEEIEFMIKEQDNIEE